MASRLPRSRPRRFTANRYIILFRGKVLKDGDNVPREAFGKVDPDDDKKLPNEVWVARSAWRPEPPAKVSRAEA